MNKLKPKEGKGKSISSIAELIRSGNSESKVVEPNKKSEEKKEVKEVKHSHQTIEEKEGIISILENVDKDKYNCKGMLYVDDEIKEVFSLLKQKGKIQTSLLVSVILESWLEENKKEVQTIINNGSNRFL